MIELYDKIRSSGGQVIAVSFSGPKFVTNYLKKYPLPFPAVSDPDRQAYIQFSLGKTTWLGMFHPKVIWGYLRLIFGGWALWKAQKNDDLLQLGGDFILDQNRTVVYEYRSAEPTDRPAAVALFQQVEKLSAK